MLHDNLFIKTHQYTEFGSNNFAHFVHISLFRTVVCLEGFYSNYCDLACSKCKVGTLCNNITGECPEGCEFNWQGPKCDSKLINSSIIVSHLSVVINVRGSTILYSPCLFSGTLICW